MQMFGERRKQKNTHGQIRYRFIKAQSKKLCEFMKTTDTPKIAECHTLQYKCVDMIDKVLYEWFCLKIQKLLNVTLYNISVWT